MTALPVYLKKSALHSPIFQLSTSSSTTIFRDHDHPQMYVMVGIIDIPWSPWLGPRSWRDRPYALSCRAWLPSWRVHHPEIGTASRGRATPYPESPAEPATNERHCQVPKTWTSPASRWSDPVYSDGAQAIWTAVLCKLTERTHQEFVYAYSAGAAVFIYQHVYRKR